MRRLARFLFGLCLAVGALGTRPAQANGRFPASSAVIFDPHDPKTIYVRVTFGLLASHDAGQTWRWVCERAVGFSGIEDPTYVVTPRGTLVAGTSSGISVSRDGGCTWELANKDHEQQPISDLAMRPDGTIVGIVSSYAKPGYLNKVVVSKDDGRTFAAIASAIDPTLLLESIEVTPSDPNRLYISAVRGEGESRTAAFLVSVNDGMSWVERKLDLTQGETAAFIANVDPKNADRVYIRTAGGPEAKTRLLVSDDAGKSWRKVFESPSPLLGFALSEDGSKVFIGAKEGVQIADSPSLQFARGSSIEVQCLGTNGSAVWACSTERSGFFVGSSSTSGRSFEARVHLEEIKGPLDCPAESDVTRICTTDWVKQRRDLGLPDPSDKGRAADPGAPALHGRGERKSNRGRNGLAGAFMLAALVMLGYEVLKRLRRRR